MHLAALCPPKLCHAPLYQKPPKNCTAHTVDNYSYFAPSKPPLRFAPDNCSYFAPSTSDFAPLLLLALPYWLIIHFF